jgi:hypothetical protein
MSYNLFLDDIRMPYEVGNYINPVNLREIYRIKKWVIVRDYDEFVWHIEQNGLPQLVSFDHDLAAIHYDPRTWTESFVYEEKTGLDCAKWLINYCNSKNKSLPPCLCHSMNPVGKANIANLIQSYYRHESTNTSDNTTFD